MRPFLTAQWRRLVMLNFAADPAVLTPLVPASTVLDDRNGKHFISIVGFRFLHTRVLGMPALCHGNFDEVNLRFYVRREVGDEIRRGVVFIKEVVARRAVAAIANRIYHEKYVCTPMRSSVEDCRIEYCWRHGSRWNSIGAHIHGTPIVKEPDSLNEFIAEHYWGYTKRRDGKTAEYQVTHAPWRIWQTHDAWCDIDAEAFYGPAFSDMLSRPPVSAFVAEGSPITVYPGHKIECRESWPKQSRDLSSITR